MGVPGDVEGFQITSMCSSIYEWTCNDLIETERCSRAILLRACTIICRPLSYSQMVVSISVPVAGRWGVAAAQLQGRYSEASATQEYEEPQVCLRPPTGL